jgi:hypothetical protein
MNIVGRDDLFIFFMVLEMKGMGRDGYIVISTGIECLMMDNLLRSSWIC